MITSYDKGDLVRVSVVFTDSAGAAQDPAQVYFTKRVPAGTLTTLHYGVDAALVKDSTGHYHVDVDCSVAGLYKYRFYSTGTGQAAVEGQFSVRASGLE